jgi:hypothetical protein
MNARDQIAEAALLQISRDQREAFRDRDYRADRDAARASRRGTTLYPRLTVLGSSWVRQDYAGGPFIVLDNGDAERLLLGDFP